MLNKVIQLTCKQKAKFQQILDKNSSWKDAKILIINCAYNSPDIEYGI